MNINPNPESLTTAVPANNPGSNTVIAPPLSIRLYSPNKVLVAALLGGLVGGGLLHWINLKALQQDKQANWVMSLSLFFLLTLPSMFFFAPNFSPGDNGGAVAAGLYWAQAKQIYGSTYEKHATNQGELGGWWGTIGAGVAGYILNFFGISIILWIIASVAPSR